MSPSAEVTGFELVEGSGINLTFLADAVAVDAGCNSMNNWFRIDENVLTANP